MTDATPAHPPTGVRAVASDGGVDFEVRLDRADLIPGRLASGSVRLTFRDGTECRGIVASLTATEQWQWRRTDRDSEGRTTTRTVTERHELQRLPVRLAGPSTHAAGEVAEFRIELPVPPLGPATFEGTVSRLTWELEVKVDVAGFDANITLDVVVLQPTGLLRAGVIDVGQFALWPSADVAVDDARGSIALDPVPLCVGAPFGGLLSIATAGTAAAAPDAAAAHALGALLLGMGGWTGMISATCFAVGSTLYSYLFLRARTIPVALAWLGLLASVLLLLALPLELAGVFRVPFLMWMPMLVFEVTFALWLLINGVAMQPNCQSRPQQP